MQKLSLGFFTIAHNERAVEGLKAALARSLESGYSCAVDESLLPLIKQDLPSIASAVPDVIVAFGGDGTILRAASLASKTNAPILGVHLGHVGFLSEITPEQFDDSLEKLTQGDYFVEKHMMLGCSVNGGDRPPCLNEVLIYKNKFGGVVDIAIEIDGMQAGTVPCDGVIISTPTGCTGYSISAGGPVIAQDLDAALITPVCPHTLSMRPIVVPADALMRFRISSEGYLAIDGRHMADLTDQDVISVTRSPRTTGFVRFSKRNVYTLIKRKLS